MTGNGNQIVAVSKTLLRLLARNCPLDDFGLRVQDFRLAQVGDLEADPPERGVTIVLYRVAMNMSARSQAPRRGMSDSIAPPLALDLHFMATPWSPDAEMQQRMLGWMLGVLDRHSRIDAQLLNEAERNAFRENAGVQLLLDAVPASDYLAMVSRAGRTLPVSATYLARLTIT